MPLLEEKEAKWTLIPRFHYEKFGKNYLLFQMNIDNIKHLNVELIKNIPEFYTELLKTWIKTNKQEEKDQVNFREVRSQIIWGNKLIRYKNKTLIFKHWIESGIIYVNDLINEKGIITSDILLSKLKIKNNWLTELHQVLQAIPNKWKLIIRENDSVNTKVNPKRVQEHCFKFRNNLIKEKTTSKQIYLQIINTSTETLIGFRKWEQNLNLDNRWKTIIQ